MFFNPLGDTAGVGGAGAAGDDEVVGKGGFTGEWDDADVLGFVIF